MIEPKTVAQRLATRFGSLEELQTNVFRAVQKFRGREFAVRYFDFRDDLAKAAADLQEYQEDLMAGTFFADRLPADLRWNHYLYFIADKNSAAAPDFEINKRTVEADRSYARKAVLTESEFDSLLSPPPPISDSAPQDIATQWLSRLDSQGLSFILDESVSAPEAARLIRAGRIQPAVGLAPVAPLTPAESAAGRDFLKNLSIAGFRQFPKRRDFSFGVVNLIVGRNGAGKTSLLEAIEFLYCGENLRFEGRLPGTKITGEFVGSAEKLFASASSPTVGELRARNSHWYAKADVKKSTLASSFGKFNFLDTDAAVNLSNNNDSRDRLRGDVARLLLGAEAERLATKIARVEEKVADAIRDGERDVVDVRRRILDARKRLEAFRATPQTSDALFSELTNALVALAWRERPIDKSGCLELSRRLHSAGTAAQRLVLDGRSAARVDPMTFSQERDRLLQAVLDAQGRAERIEKLEAEQSNLLGAAAIATARVSSIEALRPFVETGFSAKVKQLRTLREQIDTGKFRLLSPARVFDVWPALERYGNLTIGQARALAEEEAVRYELVHRERAKNLHVVESGMAAMAVLKQRLLSAAIEVLSTSTLPDHCPVCRSEFEANELRLRIAATASEDGSEVLHAAQEGLRQATTDMEKARAVLEALDALVSFAQSGTNSKVSAAMLAAEDAKSKLEEDRRTAEELRRWLEEAGRSGLTESDLQTRMSVLGIDGELDATRLEHLLRESAGVAAANAGKAELKEKEIAALWVELVENAGTVISPDHGSPLVLVQQLREQAAIAEKLVIAADTLVSHVDVWAAAGFKDTLLRWKMKPEVVHGEKKDIQPRVQARGGQAGH